MQEALLPWAEYLPKWLGWRSLGLSLDRIGAESTVREEFEKRFINSSVTSVVSSLLAVILGALAASSLSRSS